LNPCASLNKGDDMKENALRINAVIGLLVSVLFFLSAAHAAQQRLAEPPKIIRKPTDALQASAINRVEPVYPPLALSARVSGTVLVEVTIDESGNVTSARSLAGHALLKDAAAEAARMWTFKPAMLEGKPVKVVGALRFTFNLPDYILRDPVRIIERLKQQIARRPKDPRLHYQLGRAYEDNQQYEEALKAYARALELKPVYGDAQVALGSLNMKLNRYDKALDAYNQAVLLDMTPEIKAGAYRAMALIYFRRDQFQAAIEPFKQAIALAPQGSMFLNLGLTYLKLGDKTSAMEQYRLLKQWNSILAERLLKQINEAQ
jgi:TonB family protein